VKKVRDSLTIRVKFARCLSTFQIFLSKEAAAFLIYYSDNDPCDANFDGGIDMYHKLREIHVPVKIVLKSKWTSPVHFLTTTNGYVVQGNTQNNI
jgi:hypothetical protein